MSKTIEDINKKIGDKKAKVVTAGEMTRIVREIGPERAAKEVDVITTRTFGVMCSSDKSIFHKEPTIAKSSVRQRSVLSEGQYRL